MAEEANVAPAEAPKAPESVETPNTNIEQTAPETVTPFFDKMSDDDRRSIDTFLANNGGMEAFNKWKKSVSNPQPKEEEPKQPEQTAAPAQQPEQPAPQPVKIPEGYITQEEFAAQQYFNSLANNPEYANIADKINSGEVLKEMSKFGIKVSDNGAFNDRQIRDFLNMYSKTVPTTPTGAEPTNIPTVDFLQIENVNSKDEALTIMKQSMEAQAKGLAAHPKYEDAKKYLAEILK